MFVCLSVCKLFSVKDFSETTLPKILKFGTNVRYDKLYCVFKNQPIYGLSVPLFVHFSFSLTKFSVTNFSASISDRAFKFCLHNEDNRMYY